MTHFPTRGRGRPPTEQSAGQRERLLQAALELFARQGIAATPLNAVAKEAEVTPALVHYYFGSRERLIDAVVEERLRPLVAQLTAPIADTNQDIRGALLEFARGAIRTLAGTPWLPRLWVREILSEDGQLRERLLGRIAPSVAARVQALAAEAQARGELDPELDPRLLMVSLIGLTVFPFAAAPIWRRIPGNADIDAETLARHALALLSGALGAPRDACR